MRTYRFKLRRPTKAIVGRFEGTLRVCCEFYNAALQERRDAYQICKKSISFCDQSLQLKDVRAIREDVRAISTYITEEVLHRVDRAYKAFFRRGRGFPRFKSVGRYDSFTTRIGGFRVEGDKLYLSKLGSVRLRLSRPINGRPKTCTITRQPNGWFVIFVVEENQSPWIPKTGDSVGIDVGIENFATLSNGESVANPRYFRTAERKIKIAHRKVSKRSCRGANRRKAVRQLARKHLLVANQRRDFFAKLSNHLIREFDDIAVENLNIAGMVKNHSLAKSISDASWGTFISILTVKAEGAGRKVWKVPAAFTSQDCSRCGNRVKKSLAIREHRCIGCGLVLHRDHNAAINILARAEPLVSASALASATI